MASSSNSSIHTSFKYDVFLSFRGIDTRKNFVDHLYAALQRQGIHTFKDDKRLKKGRRIDHELFKSIEESKFFIIVFSKNYASSSWCLDELVKIMECHKTTDQTAYPVFYDLEPSQVRKQHGPVGEAFAQHKKEEAAGRWREALKEVADLAGWELKNTTNGHEVEFIRKIVEQISLELRSINSSVDETLIGMEIRIKDVESSLEKGSDDVRMIGIKGMGGGGKTTLARAVFGKISIQFEGKSFVENVREVSKDSLLGLKSLQKQILADVLIDQGVTINGVYDGKNMMKRMMCGRKVLVVLDDVDHIDQLEALAGASNWFKPGSRIIITTRDEQVLIAHKVKLIHEVTMLSDEEAIHLFSRHAFGREIPIQEYETQSLQVVRYAAGLPLTIKVLGSFLCGKEKPEWVDALERLKKIPLKETLEKLKLSYESLEDDYKEIFLDVACLLKGWDKDDAFIVLESCGFHARNGLRVLEQKSLITIKQHKYLHIHDHIEEMGKNIVRYLHPDEPNKHSRLWIRKEIEDILANELGTDATRCLKLWKLELSPDILMKGLRNMKKLRFLILDDDYYCHDVKFDKLSHYFPNALQYLKWVCYPYQFLPKTFRANNLVALKMSWSRIEQLWEGGERKVLHKLKFLDLSYSYLRTLDLGLTPNLEMLHLQGCDDLLELHAPVGCLKRLVFLDLGHCSRFLSNLFIRRLESLEILSSSLGLHLINESRNYGDTEWNHLLTCYYKELPSSIEKLQKFLSLRITSCTELFSGTTCALQYLRKLKLKGSITKMPKDIGHLESLEKLCLFSTDIIQLPNTICALKHLKSLKIEHCLQLQKLPEDLGHLESLEKLNLNGCAALLDIPNSICKMKRLKYLCLSYCFEVEKLPEELGCLECLVELDVKSTRISDLPQSISLLKDLHIVGNTISYETLHICTNIV